MMWRPRLNELELIRDDVRAVSLMLMSMDDKIDQILREIEDEDGWEEEEEPD